ncbi:MAG: tRNA lysidine(34) synthetase TilS [Peptococcaceae bacterium]|nr:tRNA lysidine(34) synthetase TilS [Peptococcaceae bacterium]
MAIYDKLCAGVLPDLMPTNAAILIAVSGGPDSMALAHILRRYQLAAPEKQIKLFIAHVHHGLRAESDAEEALVALSAQRWGIPCTVQRFNAQTQALLSGESVQTAGRVWRYARWREDMRQLGCTMLATAHHLGDQAETVLHRLIRGSGAAGLSGIYPKNNDVIRPLLSCSKTEILTYCRQEGLSYAVDISNTHAVYLRNKIRLELLRQLESEYNPRIQQSLGHTAELLRWDEEYFQAQMRGLWLNYADETVIEGGVALSRKAWQESPAILSRLIRAAISCVIPEPNDAGFPTVEKIMRQGQKLNWRQDFHGFHVTVHKDKVMFKPGIQGHNKEEPLCGAMFTLLKWDVWTPLPDGSAEIGLFPATPVVSPTRETSWILLDRNSVTAAALVCRYRKPGDRMYFQGLGHKALKKVFQEAEVPDTLRQRIPLVASGTEIIWIPGIRRSDSLRPELEQASRDAAPVYCCFRVQNPQISSGG